MTYSLYYFDTCPFCQRVLSVLPSLSVDVEKRNVMTHPEYRKQQQKATGRTTCPCLLITHDDGREQWMYESNDIITYLQQQSA